MIATISRPLGAGLLLAVASLAVIAALRNVARHDSAAIPEMPLLRQPAAAALAEDKSSLPARRPEVYFAAISERPLFSPSRRALVADTETLAPPDAEPVAMPQVPDAVERPSLALLGTMMSGKGWLALIRIGDAPAEWLAVGTAVTDLTISAIGPDWATLGSDSTELKLDLYPK